MAFVRSYWGLLVVLLLSIPTILPFFHSGFFPMHDDTQVARVYEMGKALTHGMFPVRWAQDLGYGYGYPIFNFYSPLPYYIGGFLTILGFDSLLATKITFVFGFLLAGILMYLLVRKFFSEIPAITASILYIYFPYHAVNTYVRGALGELYAYAFLPLVFLGFFGIYQCLNLKNHNRGEMPQTLIGRLFPSCNSWILVSALGVFFVILSHNLYAFLLLVCLIIFIILLLLFKQTSVSFYTVSALILGFCLSAFFSFPAIFEMEYTNVASQVGGGATLNDHFICTAQLWDSQWGYGGSTSSCLDGMSFKLGKVHILLYLVSIAFFVYGLLKKQRVRNDLILISAFLLSLFSIFMTTDFSKSLWSFIPQSSFVQYPWRFLGFYGFFSSIFIVLIFNYMKQIRLQAIASSVIIFFIIFINVKLFVPQILYDRNAAFYTNQTFLKWDTSKISDEYLPKDFIKPQSKEGILKTRLFSYDKGTVIEPIEEKVHRYIYNTSTSSPTKFVFRVAYFPAWNVYVDGRSTPFEFSDNWLIFPVSSGEHTLEIRFEQTRVEMLSSLISVFSILLIVVGIIKHKYYRFYGKQAS